MENLLPEFKVPKQGSKINNNQIRTRSHFENAPTKISFQKRAAPVRVQRNVVSRQSFKPISRTEPVQPTPQDLTSWSKYSVSNPSPLQIQTKTTTSTAIVTLPVKSSVTESYTAKALPKKPLQIVNASTSQTASIFLQSGGKTRSVNYKSIDIQPESALVHGKNVSTEVLVVIFPRNLNEWSACLGPQVRAIEDIENVELQFHNYSLTHIMHLSQIDHQGNIILLHSLQNGQVHVEETFVSHPWLVRFESIKTRKAEEILLVANHHLSEGMQLTWTSSTSSMSVASTAKISKSANSSIRVACM